LRPALSYHVADIACTPFSEEMNRSMNRRSALTAAALCVAIAAGCGGNGATGDASRDSAKGSAARDVKMWLPFNEGMALAAKEKKHVVIDFYTSWCHWCKVMDRETFSDPKVKSYLADNFVTIRINADSRNERLIYRGEEYTPITLTRSFGVRGFPSLAYLDREGELITIVPGFVRAATFLPFLQYVQKECYKQRMTFEEYMRKKGECG